MLTHICTPTLVGFPIFACTDDKNQPYYSIEITTDPLFASTSPCGYAACPSFGFGCPFTTIT